MENILLSDHQLIFRLFFALLLGAMIGAERLLVHKEAGMKTHALVAMGAALFILVSEVIASRYLGTSGGVDPMRMASQIVVGVGFLGAGSIMFQDSKLRGLTTAGGLWITAGIGMAAGFGLFNLALFATLLVLFILVIVNAFETPLKKMSGDWEK